MSVFILQNKMTLKVNENKEIHTESKNHSVGAMTTHPLFGCLRNETQIFTDEDPELWGVHAIINFSLLKIHYMQVFPYGPESSSKM